MWTDKRLGGGAVGDQRRVFPVQQAEQVVSESRPMASNIPSSER